MFIHAAMERVLRSMLEKLKEAAAEIRQLRDDVERMKTRSHEPTRPHDNVSDELDQLRLRVDALEEDKKVLARENKLLLARLAYVEMHALADDDLMQSAAEVYADGELDPNFVVTEREGKLLHGTRRERRG